MAKRGSVTASSLNLRQEPDGEVLASLPKGTAVDILDDRGEWLEVEAGAHRGFVAAKFVQRETRKGKTTASNLNVRAAPSGDLVGSFPQGTALTIEEEQDGWLRVRTEELEGWVSADFVDEGGDEPEPTPDEPSVEVPDGFQISGRDVTGPDGERFARTFRLGVFNSGQTSISQFVSEQGDRLGAVSPSLLRVMSAVSENEGKLEAINTWDNAFLTFGCFQWTVGTQNSGGELAAFIDRLKSTDQAVFDEHFGQHGLDVDGVRSPPASPGTGFFTLDGDKLDTAQKKGPLRSIEWAYRFYRSGFDDTVRRVQIEHAMSRIDLFYNNPRKQIRDRPVTDWVSSEFGVALLLDQHVNRPGHVPKTLTQAVDEMVGDLGEDPTDWGDQEEQKLLDRYLALREETSMTDPDKRAATTRKAVEDGDASDERGSFKLS